MKLTEMLGLANPRDIKAVTKSAPSQIHGLRVVGPGEAYDMGYVSITTNINAKTEEKILAGVCQHRDPARAILVRQYEDEYQLFIHRSDRRGADD